MKTEFKNDNLSDLMIELFTEFSNNSGNEISGLSISLNGFDQNGNVNENSTIRNLIDNALRENNKQPISTVASTIFPVNLWNPNLDRDCLYRRYESVLPQIKKCPRNKFGIYFERMVNYKDGFNQLEKIIEINNSGNHRRSAYQVSLWDPERDMVNTPRRGFPCLQHLVFSCVQNRLIVIAFYATQDIFERAYGNFLGICNLGKFISHELDIPIHEVKCYIGVEQLTLTKTRLKEILQQI